MRRNPHAKLVKRPKPARSLTKVLDQTGHVQDLVEECAEELSSVNTALKQELAGQDPLPGVAHALDKSEAVENKVQEASEELSIVNKALEHEVAKRHSLEQQLAVVTEQGDADRHAAFHDPLTGLPNRALFIDRLEHGLALAKRHRWRLAVMFVDLDKFKNINDTYGHDVGDDVLKTIAARLKENTRVDDTVSRFGGDEFLYLLMEIRDEQAAKMIAAKIVRALEAPCDVKTRNLTLSLNITASVGISIFPKDGTTADTLIKSADKAMYVAKQNKSGYSFAQ